MIGAMRLRNIQFYAGIAAELKGGRDLQGRHCSFYLNALSVLERWLIMSEEWAASLDYMAERVIEQVQSAREGGA